MLQRAWLRPVVGFLLPGIAGCGLFHADDGPALKYRLSPLPPPEIARRLGEADALYREPRTVERVEGSLELCLDSIAPGDPGGALWRAARAGAWLAEHQPGDAVRERSAQTGLAAAREAARLLPDRPEPLFFQALLLGILSDIQKGGFSRVARMEKLAKRVIEMDETYDHAGGHRFLGILCDKTKDYPIAAVGDIDDALQHLRRACSLAPEYGLNQLALAEVLIQDGELEEARERLRAVIEGAAPPDESAEHAGWVARAREILEEIKGR